MMISLQKNYQSVVFLFVILVEIVLDDLVETTKLCRSFQHSALADSVQKKFRTVFFLKRTFQRFSEHYEHKKSKKSKKIEQTQLN